MVLPKNELFYFHEPGYTINKCQHGEIVPGE